MYKLPLNVNNYIKELNIIKEIANINSYKSSKIDELVSKHSKKLRLQSITTLKNADSHSENTRRYKFTYIGRKSHQVSNFLKQFDISCVFGNSGKTGRLLGNPKDKIPNMMKSGIYSIGCDSCDMVYIGQSRRPIEKRLYEHRRSWISGKPDKSAVAK